LSNPTITGCTPCFNGAATLERALRAVQAQNVDELLLVDDGSTDGSVEIAKGLGARVITLEKNLGRGAARARAMEEAKGEFVLFCDARIEIDTNFTERALRWFDSPKTAAAFGPIGQTLTGGTSERWRERHLLKTGFRTEFTRHALLGTGAVLMRRSAVLEVGNFNSHLREGEDGELGMRLLDHGFEVVQDPDLHSTALGRDSIMRVLERYRRWNGSNQNTFLFPGYLKQIAYSIKVLAKADLKADDLPCALISLLMPHYCFVVSAWRWRKQVREFRLQRRNRQALQS
jgi:glycosyltransferase involved in cell wall biosynthesis